MKRIFFCLSFSCFLLFLLFFPRTAVACARSGLMLWFNTLLPSMLPFMILSGIFMESRLYRKASGSHKELLEICFSSHAYGGIRSAHGNFLRLSHGAKTAADPLSGPPDFPAGGLLPSDFFQSSRTAFLSSYLCVELLHRNGLYFLPMESFISPVFSPLCFSAAAILLTIILPKNSKEKRHPLLSPGGEALDASIMNSFSVDYQAGGIYHPVFPYSGNPCSFCLVFLLT